jgi:hypothetical protein
LEYLQPDFVLTIDDEPLYQTLEENGSQWGYEVAFQSEHITWYSKMNNAPIPYLTPIDLYADETLLQTGDCTTLHWIADGSAQLDGLRVEATGEQEVCPEVSTTYQLTASQGVREVTVAVQATPTYRFRVLTDKMTIVAGKCMNLSWEAEGLEGMRLYLPTAADEASITVDVDGVLEVCPERTQSFVWTAKTLDGTTVARRLSVYVSG